MTIRRHLAGQPSEYFFVSNNFKVEVMIIDSKYFNMPSFDHKLRFND